MKHNTTMEHNEYNANTSHRSTAMATRVKTEAETEIPWTIPLSLHTTLPNGQPARHKESTESTLCLIHLKYIFKSFSAPAKHDVTRNMHKLGFG